MSEFKRRLGLIIRARWGLILWSLVWLGILLVPLWRLRVTSEWQGILSVFRRPQPVLRTNFEDEVARRYPNDAGAQLAPLHTDFYRFTHPTSAPGQSIVVAPSSTRQEVERQNLAQKVLPYFAKYDELERRFPDSNAVRAQRLRDTTSGWLIKNEGPPAKDQKSSPERGVWLNRPELEASLRTAQEGARHEPNNGFYPWMQAMLCFSLDRPDEAIRALDRAGRCTKWSDDTFNTAARRIELRRRVEPVGWEASSIELWSLLLPHLAPMRSTARAATGQMRLARQRGDEARALEIAGILQRAGGVMVRSQDSLISSLVGTAVCVIAWKATTEDLPAPTKPTSNQEIRRQYLERFVVYALAHGRADLGEEAQHIFNGQDIHQLSALYNQPNSELLTKYGNIIFSTFWLNSWILHLALAGSLVWFVTWLLTRTKQKGDAARGVTLLYAFFCSGATAAILGFLTPWSMTAATNFIGEETPPIPPAIAMLQNFLPYVLIALWLLPLMGNTFLRSSSVARPELTLNRRKIEWQRLLSMGLWCLPGALLLWVRAYSYSFMGSLEALSPLITAIAVALVVASACWMAWSSKEHLALRVLTYMACWMGLLSFILVAVGKEDPFYGRNLGVLALLLAIGACVVGSRMGQRSALQDFFYRTRLTAAVLALNATLGYAGVTLWSVPVERKAQMLLQHELRVGETAFLREQLNQQK